jgi:hypothetical protein
LIYPPPPQDASGIGNAQCLYGLLFDRIATLNGSSGLYKVSEQCQGGVKFIVGNVKESFGILFSNEGLITWLIWENPCIENKINSINKNLFIILKSKDNKKAS